MKKNMQKVKKVFHSFKELEEEWQRHYKQLFPIKPDDEKIKNFRIYSNKVDEMFRLVSGDK